MRLTEAGAPAGSGAQSPAAPRALAASSLRGRRVVLLGSTGFVGRHLRRSLLAEGARLLEVSPSATVSQGSSHGPPVGAVALDLLHTDAAGIAELLDSFRAEVVVNAAGRLWEVSEEAMWRSNVELVRQLVAALTLLDRRPRLLQLGSVHEYGLGDPRIATSEDQEPAPLGAYGRSKLAATRAVLAASGPSGLDGVVLRVANVTGSGQPPGSLFGRISAHLAEAGSARGRGEQPDPLTLKPLRAHRDLVDVADMFAAVAAAACVPEERLSERLFNVGSGRAVVMRDVVEDMIRLSGLPVPLVEVPDERPAPESPDWQQLDIARARRVLGWVPRYELRESLRDMLPRTTASGEEGTW
ncbi:NAD-dependent epimerase/dehydratase family protein [Streptomyces sp. NPDC055189]